MKIIRLTRVLVLEMGLEPIRTNVHWILSPTCLPIPPLEPVLLKITANWYIILSEKRDSNPRPPPWQGDALPLSYFRIMFMNEYLFPDAGANLR